VALLADWRAFGDGLLIQIGFARRSIAGVHRYWLSALNLQLCIGYPGKLCPLLNAFKLHVEIIQSVKLNQCKLEELFKFARKDEDIQHMECLFISFAY
jgi:hypothetical protein